MYWEDTCRKAPKWSFLGGGSVPLGLDEDDSAVSAVEDMTAGEHDGSCEILNR
jgi:hypothetical protein